MPRIKLAPSVGKNIKVHRQLLEMTQTELAKRVGVAPAYISQIESQLRRPSLKVLERIATELRVSTPALLANPGDMTKTQKINALRAILMDLREAS